MNNHRNTINFVSLLPYKVAADFHHVIIFIVASTHPVIKLVYSFHVLVEYTGLSHVNKHQKSWTAWLIVKDSHPNDLFYLLVVDYTQLECAARSKQ